MAECEALPASGCVEPSPPEAAPLLRWKSETQRKFTELIPKLKLCTKGIDPSQETKVALTFGFSESGTATETRIFQTTTTDCEVTSCIKRVLHDFTTSAPKSKLWHFTAHLVTQPGQSEGFILRDVEEGSRFISEADEKKACADESKPMGRLPPDDVQNIIRDQYEKFRQCYETGLGRNNSLCGRIQLRFVIGDKGKVSSVQVFKGTTMPDCDVAQCIKRHFYDLNFPEPDGGTVTVVYPIMFAPTAP